MRLSDTQRVAHHLMVKHGLWDWTFKFDNSVRRFGVCIRGTKTISMSKSLTKLNEMEEVKDVILHEIAHALVGAGHGHDSVWKAKAKEIGAKPERCYDSQEVVTPKAKYTAICPNCKHEHKRHRLSKVSVSCGVCSGGSFNPTCILTFTTNN